MCPPGIMFYVRYLCLFTYSDVQHILLCHFVLFVFDLCIVYSILSVSLDFLFVIAPSVFSNVYLLNIDISQQIYLSTRYLS
jgi:hypothetical protein